VPPCGSPSWTRRSDLGVARGLAKALGCRTRHIHRLVDEHAGHVSSPSQGRRETIHMGVPGTKARGRRRDSRRSPLPP
jgi:hypothetical protein